MQMAVDVLRLWLALWRVPGIGPRGFHRVLSRCGSVAAVFASGAAARLPQLPAALWAGVQAPDWAGVDRDLAWLAQAEQHHIVTFLCADYPPLLKCLPDPPPLLFVIGERAALQAPAVAVVGSRQATPMGAGLAQGFAAALSQAGLTVVSGLARGIDAAAHWGACGVEGKTVAVMATGPETIYPRAHARLADHIVAQGGALVTENAVGVAVNPRYFSARNRLISGLSYGVLVVEARCRSGSLMTAHLAADQGRDVFVLPGSLANPQAAGCHRLIQEGAQLVTQPQDIWRTWETQGWVQGEPPPDLQSGQQRRLSRLQQQLLLALDDAPCAEDELASRLALTVPEVSSMLIKLTQLGWVVPEWAGYSRAQL